MGTQALQQRDSKQSINLQIDKSSYQIYDKIQGYAEFSATQSDINDKLQFKLQLIGSHEQSVWETEQGNNTFIFKDEIIKSYQNDVNHQSVAFQYNLDLISTTGQEENQFYIQYYILAIIQQQVGQENILIQFQSKSFHINRPYQHIERPIQKEIQNQIRSFFCCNYGQIQLKVSLEQKDFLINDVLKILIDCDQSLSRAQINNYQINLLSRSSYKYGSAFIYSSENIFNTVSFAGQISKKYQIIQSFPIIYQEKNKSYFHASMECPNFRHSHYIQIFCTTGPFTNDFLIEIPIILYQTQEYQMKLYSNSNQINRNEFSVDIYQQFKTHRFLEIKVKQEEWQDQVIDFPQTNLLQQNQEINSNLIMIQSNQQ